MKTRKGFSSFKTNIDFNCCCECNFALSPNNGSEDRNVVESAWENKKVHSNLKETRDCLSLPLEIETNSNDIDGSDNTKFTLSEIKMFSSFALHRRQLSSTLSHRLLFFVFRKINEHSRHRINLAVWPIHQQAEALNYDPGLCRTKINSFGSQLRAIASFD